MLDMTDINAFSNTEQPKGGSQTQPIKYQQLRKILHFSLDICSTAYISYWYGFTRA